MISQIYPNQEQSNNDNIDNFSLSIKAESQFEININKFLEIPKFANGNVIFNIWYTDSKLSSDDRNISQEDLNLNKTKEQVQ